jgi:hypothetical protein
MITIKKEEGIRYYSTISSWMRRNFHICSILIYIFLFLFVLVAYHFNLAPTYPYILNYFFLKLARQTILHYDWRCWNWLNLYWVCALKNNNQLKFNHISHLRWIDLTNVALTFPERDIAEGTFFFTAARTTVKHLT